MENMKRVSSAMERNMGDPQKMILTLAVDKQMLGGVNLEDQAFVIRLYEGLLIVDEKASLMRNKNTGRYLTLDQYKAFALREAIELYLALSEEERKMTDFSEFEKKLSEGESDFEMVSYTPNYDEFMSDEEEEKRMRQE